MTELPDRLLRSALRNTTSTAPSEACVDASALAAWAEGTMSAADCAVFERHAADCARCQALMAAMAQSDPPPEIRPAWWRRSPFSWLMPLAAAAALVAIVVDLARMERQATVVPARAESRAFAPVAPPVPKTPPAATAPSVSAPPVARARGLDRADVRRGRPVATEPTGKQKAAASLADARGGVAAPPTTEQRERDAIVRRSPPVPQTAAAQPPSTPAPAPAASVSAAAAAKPAAPLRSEDALDRVAAPVARMAAVSSPIVIASPDHDSQWRIVGGAIEHTSDGGRSWQSQSSAVSAPIRAGAAPAARVCWLVGARGLVMLTTDGLAWRRIDFPDTADLIAVEAIDGAQATVTTAIGRRYVTRNGGTSWTIR